MSNSKKRHLKILVLSDIHLGTFGCHAKELLSYLKTVKPETVVLNGDIIDIWQFSKRYWPKSHMKVIRQITDWMSKGVKVYYITGNHDEMLRKFSGFKMGKFSIQNKVILELEDGKKAWFFHGDVFDVTMQHSKWLARLGATGYDSLILLNRFVNLISEKVFKKGKLSLSKKIKNSVKTAVSFISNFELTAAEIGIQNGYGYVVCGHIHQPEIKEIVNSNGSIVYLNSGDWIENLTALEYSSGRWIIYKYNELEFSDHFQEVKEEAETGETDLFDTLLKEMNVAALR